MSEPNQLLITSKKPKTYPAKTFGYFNFDSTFEAYKILKPASFALYLYLLRDSNDFERALYKVDFEKVTGHKKTAYYGALQELKDKGYLIQINGNHWNFYPDGSSANADTKIIVSANAE